MNSDSEDMDSDDAPTGEDPDGTVDVASDTAETIDLSNLSPGGVPVVEPFDDVSLEFHGLPTESSAPLFIYATVERDGGDSLLSYNIVDLNEDETSFIVEPERLRNKRAEEAIEKVGGTVRTPQKA
jgi:hypothetical protein